ncbi:hypothetical protein MUK42_22590 [Musa troglodytarum]|uniref:Uncharacterized protein n=1 Tax=Musa troglodytarum TaxID=320322 RepID=A0A9E7K960_9LILI|nr:hypothetical protein MUK42_22590 [Musa troglodytarum]
MGRAPWCDKARVKRDRWSPEEDAAPPGLHRQAHHRRQLDRFAPQSRSETLWQELPLGMAQTTSGRTSSTEASPKKKTASSAFSGSCVQLPNDLGGLLSVPEPTTTSRTTGTPISR